jgi:hypothetical protein
VNIFAGKMIFVMVRQLSYFLKHSLQFFLRCGINQAGGFYLKLIIIIGKLAVIEVRMLGQQIRSINFFS